jgi:hypothetical protein
MATFPSMLLVQASRKKHCRAPNHIPPSLGKKRAGNPLIHAELTLPRQKRYRNVEDQYVNQSSGTFGRMSLERYPSFLILPHIGQTPAAVTPLPSFLHLEELLAQEFYVGEAGCSYLRLRGLNPVPLLKPTALSSPLHQYDNIRRRKPSHTT